MKNYDRVNPRKPEGIEARKAYIVGGGIAGLSAAAFLIRDAHMPGHNITVYDQLPVFGGSMDSCGNAESGYISRGERELEPYMECLWDLFGSVPSLYEEGRTVLDETRETNQQLEIDSRQRLWERGFKVHDQSELGLSERVKEQMVKMMTTSESELENVTIADWFSPEYFESNLWYYWASMLAFQPYHSLIEMKRYTVRFMQHLDGIEHLKGILRTKYDQYNSLILPLQKYLADHQVQFVANTMVSDMELRLSGGQKTVTALVLQSGKTEFKQPIGGEDLVYFTNGSMTQNSSQGSMTEAPIMNRSTDKRGCFTLWEKLAQQDECFGHPGKFISAMDKSHFVSFTMTIRDYPQLFQYIEEKTGNPTGAGGATTFVDHPWFMNFNAPLQPVFPKQPENVQVLWGYGLHANEIGACVKKPMTACTGEEILQEFLYCCGLENKFDEVRQHCTVIPVMMPYITSQFMPRGLKDRPQIIPEGCTNLALIGQFVELEGDVVFTVETSVRTAMMAVYKTMHLDKPITPLFAAQYDVRIIVACLKKMLGKDRLAVADLPKINPLKLPQTMQQLVDAVNTVPKMPDYYLERAENR
ncbi:MAG: oleate hydratase [Candidatus Limiplasma sp.]|nr:oleate hydratase [Candidatus Limiplasma sp.]